MWKDRLSGRSTPSGLPPRYRSQSPAPRASSHLAPSALYTQRPNLSSRSSSISLISNQSTSSLLLSTHLSNESALKHSSGDRPVVDVTNPLNTLERILSEPAEDSDKRIPATSIPKERSQIKDLEIPSIGDFGNLSLAAFADAERWKEAKTKHAHGHESTSLEECMLKLQFILR